jgi:hypothetical protein
LLIQANKEIIDKTREELATEFENNYLSYISYFSNVTVMVGGKIINGQMRNLFQKLLEQIFNAYKHKNEIVISFDFLYNLIEFQSKLDLQLSTHFECSNCGGGLGRCPDCLIPYSVKIKDGAINVACPKCSNEVSTDQNLICECGTELEIANLENHIQIYPGASLQQAIQDFIDQNLDELSWKGVFVIDGLVLKLLQLRKPKNELPGLVRLNQLGSWQDKARYSIRKSNQKYLPLLAMTKEKCYRNNTPPTIESCEKCKATKIKEAQIYKKKEVCLLRIFGLPIEKAFDGIHHGFEIADIKYEDSYEGTAINLGIHLKSRTKSRPKGLGKSVYPIKSLYTQTFYSAYQALKGDINFDVIGISIPNAIRKEVVDSIQLLLNKLGYSLLVLEEDDWLKIFDAALETVAFEKD